MELTALEAISGLGVGAVFAIVMFIVYRIDRKASEKRIHDVNKAHAERLEYLLEQDQQSREKNTRALTKLTTLITRLNGRLK